MTTSENNKLNTLNILVLVAFIGKITVNYLSNALPINGFTPGQLSDLYPNEFVPAGFTFSIWGVIYLACVAFVIQVFRKNINPKIKYLFLVVCLLNVSWLLAWHYQFIALSLTIMLAFLSVLIYWYLAIRNDITTQNDLIVKVMSSLYLGWISVATAANITTSMVHNNLLIGSQETESVITLILCLVILGITSLMVLKKSDFVYALVITWAAFGIYSKRVADLLMDDALATYGAFILGGGAAILATFAILKKRQSY